MADVQGTSQEKESIENKIQAYDEMFKDRYTNSDTAYVERAAAGKLPPPCVPNWYAKPARTDRRGSGRDRYHSTNYGHQRYNTNYHSPHYQRGRGSYGNRHYRPY